MKSPAHTGARTATTDKGEKSLAHAREDHAKDQTVVRGVGSGYPTTGLFLIFINWIIYISPNPTCQKKKNLNLNRSYQAELELVDW